MWYNPLMRQLLNSPLHSLVSKNMMLITYTGRKSGKTYTTPVSCLEIEGALYTLSSRERVWWRNLRGGAEVSLRLQGKNIPARAQVIEEPEEIHKILGKFLETAPQFARYLNIALDAQGIPDADDMGRQSRARVFVRTKL
ncbi:MAG: nitroreductase family deazaflavin-dependent oxidoreductase [Chloroflexi bacterium]|nr:nitroreductase family deazaflavin-dependent oxidoreductase [Chloroflexota bacterium]